MIELRRISSARWWNKQRIWKIFLFAVFVAFVRFSKGSLYRDFYYLISRPFWPGEFQRELILKSSNQELMIKLAQIELDNLRLRELLSLQRLSDNDKLNASVISRQTSSWWKTILLNKGVKDGVKTGDAVVGPGGLLGIVQNTSWFTSSVELLTSPESKVGAWAQRSNIHGLLVGLGSNSPKMIFYSKDADIKVGDLVLSSPASTLLPPNLPIGIIETVDKESSPTVISNIQLIANPQAIDWVQVLQIKI